MTFLAAGTLWFWIFVIAAFICFLVATEKGSGTGSTATMIVTLAAFYFFGNKIQLINFFKFCGTHGLILLLSIVAYIIVGVFWSIIKWYFFLLKNKEEQEDLVRDTNLRHTIVIPQVRDHKEGIMVWMFYWPFSAIWTLIDQPIKRIYQIIYRKISGYLQGMSNKMFASLTEAQRKNKEAVDKEVERKRRERTESSKYQ
jgi:hypothetical protein